MAWMHDNQTIDFTHLPAYSIRSWSIERNQGINGKLRVVQEVTEVVGTRISSGTSRYATSFIG
ncbi:hypothetical protein NXT3_PB00458 (plasmid) [Sinorhizobium fredii]|uniref:Uncharacterized protein n=1 Tax=Rhizobium fredii TaxID=380 RepID=A0A2L0HC84_RHIFR|nr:hypothetical protein NXT3_PB00458 [Sinorhizobium fredii]